MTEAQFADPLPGCSTRPGGEDLTELDRGSQIAPGEEASHLGSSWLHRRKGVTIDPAS